MHSPEWEPNPRSQRQSDGVQAYHNQLFDLLNQLRARDEKEQEDQEEKDRDAWNLQSHILPLTLTADDNFFNKYWPPPPPEPEPIEEEVKGKKKDKKKKQMLQDLK